MDAYMFYNQCLLLLFRNVDHVNNSVNPLINKMMDYSEKDMFDPFQENSAIIHIGKFDSEKNFKSRSTEGVIMIVYDGKISLKGGSFSGSFTAGNFIFIPPGIEYTASFIEDTSLIFFSLKKHILFYGEYLRIRCGVSDQLHTGAYDITFLPANQNMGLFVESVVKYCSREKTDIRFSSLKTEELLYLIDDCYSKGELSGFFSSFLSPNPQFAYFVLNNYLKIKTARDFAELCNLSLSAFEKEFRRVFNAAPYNWMKQRKADRLMEIIYYSDKPFKEICEEYDFSSTSQLNDFCKREWGMTPGKMRSEMRSKM